MKTFNLKHVLYFTKDISILEKYHNNKSMQIRNAIASNHDCPLYILEKLADNSSSNEVIISILYNKNCSEDLLIKFHEDHDPNIRYAVVLNPRCPISIYYKLCLDKEQDIREVIVSSKRCPVDILEKLSNDDSILILHKIFLNNKCPIYLLEKFYNYKEPLIRGAIAQHPNCPIFILKELSNDKSDYVRCCVANVCDSDILEKLVNDECSEVLKHIVINKNCSFNILKRIYKEHKKHKDYEFFKKKILKHPNWIVKCFE